MRKLLTGALCATIALLTIPAWSQLKPKEPVVTCPRVEQAPTLDGRLDPGEWAVAGVLSDFMLLGATGLPSLPTRVYVMHTTRALYIGAQLYDDRPSEIVAGVTERDGRVYEDDCLELFIDTTGAREEYAHFVVNSLGAKYDAFNHDVAENFDWNVFAAVNDSGWALEIEIPFDRGIPPQAGERWVLGLARNAARAGELSTWGRHERDFHEPTAFGEMAFSGPSLTARLDDMGARALGDNAAAVTVRNTHLEGAEGKVNVVVMGDDRRSHYFGSVKFSLVPEQPPAQVHVPYKVRRCGPAWMALSVTDHEGTVAWRTGAFPIELPAVSAPLDQVAAILAEAWRRWAALSPSDNKDALQAELDALQREWSYLEAQVSPAMGMPTARLYAVEVEVKDLRTRASDLLARVAAAR